MAGGSRGPWVSQANRVWAPLEGGSPEPDQDLSVGLACNEGSLPEAPSRTALDHFLTIYRTQTVLDLWVPSSMLQMGRLRHRDNQQER